MKLGATFSWRSPTSSAATRSLPVLFLLASVLSGSAVLPQAQPTDVYLTALGIVLTSVYLWGLITRPHRQLLRMGMDSLSVFVLYAAGVAGLVAVTNH